MEHIKKNQQYQEVSYSEREEEEFLSSTEVESQHDADEKDTEKAKAQRPRRTRSRRSRTSLWVAQFRRFRWLVDVVLLIINISLSVVLLRNFNQENATSTMQVGSSFDGTGPDFPTKIVKFEADPAFVPNNTAEFFSPATLEKWNTMMPVGAGWGAPTEDTFFTTSMTHQLHCLFMMGRIYAALTSEMPDKLMSDYHSHYLHCVDYLRQGIMCSADMAMEPHEQTDPDDNGPMDGSWNGHHVCKDYGHIMPYLEEQIDQGIRKVLPIDD
ncbi:hypothetical protein PMIN06_000147 [Paraphaeosphaeria minitans]|uniref:Oxidase ustYa n=1 Tax=Paraphaeosphaeria minitans TaxID=565426 RepID=A0A9P6G537_9PLEO|nr:hypothetical protein PMIN01_12936 [Paraphaeosphaeria minitans]